MQRWFPALCAILLAPLGHAQSRPSAAIPATAPTQTLSVSDLPSAHPAVTQAPTGSSQVDWDGAVLKITAKGDSLRNILRSIARSTGMRITGGVPSEPVFGTYGPGPVQDVVARLLDGIAVNMMLVNEGTRPKELLLTARNGGASAPSAPLSDEDQNIPRPNAPVGTYQPPPSRQPGPTLPAAPPPIAQIPPSENNVPQTDANGQPQSPNGVRTPEQIFEELRKRQGGAAPSQ